jgi:general stress protein 26
MNSDLDRFYKLIENIEIAMMTTRRDDGHLRSRPMANQKRSLGADLWFVTLEDSAKLDDLAVDDHVNLAYFNSGTMEWISVSGVAITTTDSAKIKELYAEDWKVWFPDEGDPRHGTPDDPRMVLIGVTIHQAEFLQIDKPKPVVMYEIAKGWLTGEAPQLGEVRHLRPGRSG